MYVWYLELTREPRHVAQQTRYQNLGLPARSLLCAQYHRRATPNQLAARETAKMSFQFFFRMHVNTGSSLLLVHKLDNVPKTANGIALDWIMPDACHHEFRYGCLSAEGAKPELNNRRKCYLRHVGRGFVGGWRKWACTYSYGIWQLSRESKFARRNTRGYQSGVVALTGIA